MISFPAIVDNKKFTLILKFVDSLQLDDIDIQTSRGNKITQLLNSIIKRGLLDIKFKEYGFKSKFIDPKSFMNNYIFDKNSQVQLYVGNGFFTTTQISFQTPLLLIDSCCKIFRGETALQFIYSFQTDEEAREQLVDQVVKANYGNEKTYIVADIDSSKNPMSYFDYQGIQITYFDYFLNRYQIKIQDKKQPLMISFVKDLGKIYLIPELMQMTGLTPQMQKNRFLMKDLSQFTQKKPHKKIEENQKLIQQLNPKLQKYGININQPKDIPQIEGYIVPKPKITIGVGQYANNSYGNYNLDGLINQPGTLSNWILIYPQDKQQDADEFSKSLQDVSNRFGIRVEDPLYITVRCKASGKEWIAELDKQFQKAKYTFVVSLMAYENQQIYNDLKQYLLVKIGVAHQNVLLKSLNKNFQSVCSNIILQINVKLGNRLWVVQRPENLPQKTMIIGIDVFHHKKNESYAGFVASVDPFFTKYYSQVVKQNKKGSEELIDLNQIMKKALDSFWEETRNRFLPECIIVYRDGVGDSQILDTINNEIQSIKNSFVLMSDKIKNYNPSFTFILVNKRINQRLFVQENQQFQNPESGTVVLDKITLSNFDFFMVAQNVNQGTCTPTHYTICQNDTQMTITDFIQLTYFQTFNYYNWRGPVRVPGPVMYAHKLAYLAGQSIKNNPIHKQLMKINYQM